MFVKILKLGFPDKILGLEPFGAKVESSVSPSGKELF